MSQRTQVIFACEACKTPILVFFTDGSEVGMQMMGEVYFACASCDHVTSLRDPGSSSLNERTQ